MPPYDTLDTLIKLTKTLKKYITIKKIIHLGDIFHDANGYYRLNVNEKMIFDHICNKYNIAIPLTIDQKPNIFGERNRIENMNGSYRGSSEEEKVMII